jgi:hypothetical protein
MLEKTEWMCINRGCYVLVDEDMRVLAVVYTSYDDTEGDQNIIWDVEMNEEPFGCYVSLLSAQFAVQKFLAEVTADEQAQKKKKERKRKKVTSDVSND